MDITRKIIRGFTVTSSIIFGLAACSSTPAPWAQADDSPWGSKHEAEAQNIPSEEAVYDVSLNDPVLLADPEPESETYAIVMQEPEMVTPEVIAPVVVEEELSAAVVEEESAVAVEEEPVSSVVEGEAATAIVEDGPVEQNIMAMHSAHYAVQVFASKTEKNAERFKNSKDLTDLITVKTDRSGYTIYVLVDIYPDRITANAAAVELETKTGSKPGSKPWVRSVAGLQKIVAE